MADYQEDGSTVNYDDVEGLFEDKGKGQGNFIQVFDHSICKRQQCPVDPATGKPPIDPATGKYFLPPEGWDGPHMTTNPKTKEHKWTYAYRYDRLVARVVDIYKQTKEFDASKGGGKVTNWNIVLLSRGERVTLQLTWIDHVLKRFLKVAPNIDFEKPLLISAFGAKRDGDTKQAVSFRQWDGLDVNEFKDTNKWKKVDEYWKRPLGPDGKPIDGSESKGLDGSVLPQPIQDEEDDSWDYKAQNKFLAASFKDNVLPKIKAIAEKHGLNNADNDGAGNLPTHSGGAVIPDDEADIRNDKPFDPVAKTMEDMISGARTAEIKRLAIQLGFDPNAVVQKLVAVDLGELTQEAGGYVVFKLRERVKAGATAPAPLPPVAPPVAVAPPPPVVQAPVVAEVGDAWEPAEAPVAPATPTTAPYDPNSNDDIEW